MAALMAVLMALVSLAMREVNQRCLKYSALATVRYREGLVISPVLDHVLLRSKAGKHDISSEDI